MKNNRYRKKLLVWILIATIIPLLICSTLLMLLFLSATQETIYAQSKNTLQKIVAELSSTIDQYGTTSTILRNSNTIQTALLDRAIDNYKTDLYIEVLLSSQQIKNYSGIGIYDAGGLLKFSTDEHPHERLPFYEGVIKESRENPSQFVTFVDSDGTIKTAIDMYNYFNLKIGYIVGAVSKDSLSYIIYRNKTDSNNVTLLDSDGNTLISTSPIRFKDYFERTLKTKEKISSSFLNHDVFIKTEPFTGITVIVHQPSVLTSSHARLLVIITILCSAFCILICILASIVLSKNLSDPIYKIIEGMNQVKEGDLQAKIEVMQNDEIGLIARNFNAMTDELNQHVQSEIEQQKRLTDVQVSMLQSQLNPHFLYNTLDTIKWLAKISKNNEISSLSYSLANILRQSIDLTQFITVKKELALIKDYIEIQKIRLSDKFQFSMSVEEGLLDCIVPKLIIQPIVENSILHAFKKMDRGSISISVFKEKENLLIEVKDDGCGMSDEQVDSINNYEPKNSTGHLGIYNVNVIIKLNYGNEYGIKVNSKINSYTRVVIMLPATKDDSC